MAQLWCAVWGHEVDNHRFQAEILLERRCRCGTAYLGMDGKDPYQQSALFNKKVRYLCGVFGHRVHVVTDRDGYREFACHCGHTFLKPQQHATHINHPAICVVSGHRIRYLAARAGYVEYVCRDCGHPFCFVEPVDR